MTNLTMRPGAPPGAPLELTYDPDEAPEALRLGLLADGRVEQEEAVRTLRIGKRLARLRDMSPGERRRHFGVSTLEEFVEGAAARRELGFGWKQAKKYLRLRRLPLEPFAGLKLSLGTLLRIEALARAGADAAALAGRCRRGEALPALSRRTREQLTRPHRLAERARASLRRAADDLARLYTRTEGWDMGLSWAQELDDALCGLVLGYAARRGQPVHALWRERRGADRALGAREPAGAAAGEPSDDEGMRGDLPARTPAASLGADTRPAGPESPAPAEEPWHVPVVRAVLARLREGEERQLARLLMLALAGRPPAELIGLLREVGRRLHDEPQELQDDLQGWIAQVATGDLASRWPYLYNFFTAAQLPGFRVALHSLRAVALPPEARALLDAACAYWPLADEAAGPAGAPRLPAELRVAAERLAAFMASKDEANVEALSWVWMEACDLKPELDALAREVAAGP